MTDTEVSTAIATIEAEVMEPLSEGKARVLDRRIRQAGIRVSVEMDKFLELLKESMDGQIHVALGFPSWVAYFKDTVGSLAWEGRDQRKALANTLAGKGVSNRAAAAILGVDEGTVRNDLKGAENSAPIPDKKKGSDGKDYPATPKARDDNIIEAEVVEEDPPEEPQEERKATDVINDFAENMDYLAPNVQAFIDLLKDDAELFPKARRRIAQRHLNPLQDFITDLQTVVDALMEG